MANEEPKIYIPWTEDLAVDELFVQLVREANEYEAARTTESDGKEGKKTAGDAINEKLAMLVITSGAGYDPDEVDGIVLSPPDEAGNQKVWQRSKRKGSEKIDAALLLQNGVSAEVIRKSTTTGEGSVSWTVSSVKASTLAKKVTG